ncbi:unnamed protein product [Euphydryas editha]|uniref:Sodium channel protein Nach n=1 Tax=Euphydryas editha TaxID=104508 RepID=A0AAU9UQG2_EUPED|nr:unnamed protein product [Euphydryas editha]
MNTYRRKSRIHKIITSIIENIKIYCLNTSIHGFYHIAAPGRHWTERVLWLVVTSIAVWGVVDISLGQWQRYNENPTVVTLEKDFRTWRFNLPAVTACDQDRVDPDKLELAIKSRWNVGPDDGKYEYLKNFTKIVANSDLYNLGGYEHFKDDQSLNVDLFELAIEVMPEYRIKTDSLETLPTQWTPVMTETGACYTINSIAIWDISIEKSNRNDTTDPVSCKYSSQSCYIILQCKNIIDFYVHSPYDVPNIMQPPYTTYPSLNVFTELSTLETRAEDGVRELPPRSRHCLYADEPTKESRKVYSTNMCRQDCRSRLAMQLCGCIPFYYFYNDGPKCTPKGMFCLSAHAHRLAIFNGVKCMCSQQCLDSIFREFSKDQQVWNKAPFHDQGTLRLKLRPPRERYSRYIVFHLQDLIVSFGGAAGLFLGASFISFVEIIYFILECLLRFKSRGSRDATKVLVKKRSEPYENQIKELNNILERI